ncbi:UNVERIFIED_CONTAM: hypothetical protein HHA_454310 [Hammondia hammondi]|eukprot:XP_008887819.1 hypothetical protein HHA_454310 [Hammondia hammondi]
MSLTTTGAGAIPHRHAEKRTTPGVHTQPAGPRIYTNLARVPSQAASLAHEPPEAVPTFRLLPPSYQTPCFWAMRQKLPFLPSVLDSSHPPVHRKLSASQERQSRGQARLPVAGTSFRRAATVSGVSDTAIHRPTSRILFRCQQFSPLSPGCHPPGANLFFLRPHDSLCLPGLPGVSPSLAFVGFNSFSAIKQPPHGIFPVTAIDNVGTPRPASALPCMPFPPNRFNSSFRGNAQFLLDDPCYRMYSPCFYNCEAPGNSTQRSDPQKTFPSSVRAPRIHFVPFSAPDETSLEDGREAAQGDQTSEGRHIAGHQEKRQNNPPPDLKETAALEKQQPRNFPDVSPESSLASAKQSPSTTLPQGPPSTCVCPRECQSPCNAPRGDCKIKESRSTPLHRDCNLATIGRFAADSLSEPGDQQFVHGTVREASGSCVGQFSTDVTVSQTASVDEKVSRHCRRERSGDSTQGGLRENSINGECLSPPATELGDSRSHEEETEAVGLTEKDSKKPRDSQEIDARPSRWSSQTLQRSSGSPEGHKRERGDIPDSFAAVTDSDKLLWCPVRQSAGSSASPAPSCHSVPSPDTPCACDVVSGASQAKFPKEGLTEDSPLRTQSFCVSPFSSPGMSPGALCAEESFPPSQSIHRPDDAVSSPFLLPTGPSAIPSPQFVATSPVCLVRRRAHASEPAQSTSVAFASASVGYAAVPSSPTGLEGAASFCQLSLETAVSNGSFRSPVSTKNKAKHAGACEAAGAGEMHCISPFLSSQEFSLLVPFARSPGLPPCTSVRTHTVDLSPSRSPSSGDASSVSAVEGGSALQDNQSSQSLLIQRDGGSLASAVGGTPVFSLQNRRPRRGKSPCTDPLSVGAGSSIAGSLHRETERLRKTGANTHVIEFRNRRPRSACSTQAFTTSTQWLTSQLSLVKNSKRVEQEKGGKLTPWRSHSVSCCGGRHKDAQLRACLEKETFSQCLQTEKREVLEHTKKLEARVANSCGKPLSEQRRGEANAVRVPRSLFPGPSGQFPDKKIASVSGTTLSFPESGPEAGSASEQATVLQGHDTHSGVPAADCDSRPSTLSNDSVSSTPVSPGSDYQEMHAGKIPMCHLNEPPTPASAIPCAALDRRRTVHTLCPTTVGRAAPKAEKDSQSLCSTAAVCRQADYSPSSSRFTLEFLASAIRNTPSPRASPELSLFLGSKECQPSTAKETGHDVDRSAEEALRLLETTERTVHSNTLFGSSAVHMDADGSLPRQRHVPKSWNGTGRFPAQHRGSPLRNKCHLDRVARAEDKGSGGSASNSSPQSALRTCTDIAEAIAGCRHPTRLLQAPVLVEPRVSGRRDLGAGRHSSLEDASSVCPEDGKKVAGTRERLGPRSAVQEGWPLCTRPALVPESVCVCKANPPCDSSRSLGSLHQGRGVRAASGIECPTTGTLSSRAEEPAPLCESHSKTFWLHNALADKKGSSKRSPVASASILQSRSEQPNEWTSPPLSHLADLTGNSFDSRLARRAPSGHASSRGYGQHRSAQRDAAGLACLRRSVGSKVASIAEEMCALRERNEQLQKLQKKYEEKISQLHSKLRAVTQARRLYSMQAIRGRRGTVFDTGGPPLASYPVSPVMPRTAFSPLPFMRIVAPAALIETPFCGVETRPRIIRSCSSPCFALRGDRNAPSIHSTSVMF